MSYNADYRTKAKIKISAAPPQVKTGVCKGAALGSPNSKSSNRNVSGLSVSLRPVVAIVVTR